MSAIESPRHFSAFNYSTCDGSRARQRERRRFCSSSDENRFLSQMRGRFGQSDPGAASAVRRMKRQFPNGRNPKGPQKSNVQACLFIVAKPFLQDSRLQHVKLLQLLDRTQVAHNQANSTSAKTEIATPSFEAPNRIHRSGGFAQSAHGNKSGTKKIAGI